MRALRWPQSFAVKSFAIAFVATHIPLIGLIALLALNPGKLAPLGVLAAALVATVVAAVLVIALLWRLLRPLRLAADGLRDFMQHGHPLRLDAASGDEVGRLVQVLVLALAHLDRSRAPLLHAGALALERKAASTSQAEGAQVMVLLEVDQWKALDEGARLHQMQHVQAAMNRALAALLRRNEYMLPWGRGRFLLVLDCVGADAVERLQPLCEGLRADSLSAALTCSAVLEPRASHSAAWPATLQRLEHKLFALRLEGRTAVVA